MVVCLLPDYTLTAWMYSAGELCMSCVVPDAAMLFSKKPDLFQKYENPGSATGFACYFNPEQKVLLFQRSHPSGS